MSTKYKLILAAIVTAVAFAAGRYSTPVKTVEIVKTVEVEKKTSDTEANRNKHKVTTVKEKENKDGSKETTTTIDESTETSKKTNSTDSTATETESTKETTRQKDSVNISALYGVSTSKETTYGLAVTKPLLGPITLGVWGLTNKTFGFSLGLSL